MKSKNKPRREQKKKEFKKKKPAKPFNPWIVKYFDLNGTGIERCKDEQLNERAVLQNKARSNQGNNRNER